jgi:hypothetical protein
VATRSVPRSSAVAALFVGVASAIVSCAVTVSFDDYGVTAGVKPPKPAIALFGVHGSVTGLAGERTSVMLNGTSIDVSDGPFAFPAALADGVEFEVTVQDPPKHVCAIARNKGKVAGADATGVDITCVSRDVTLQALSVSVGPLSPAFDPAIRSYTVRARTKGVLAADKGVPTTLTVSATPANPAARVSFGGVALEAGKPSLPVVVHKGPNALDIAVAAAGGEAHYTVAVVGEDFDYLKASDTAQWEAFGSSLAMSGDTLAVASTGRPSGVGYPTDGPKTRAVYVFTRSASLWSQQAVLPLGGPGLVAVAIDGDKIATAGADGQTGAGSVAVYIWLGMWVRQDLDTTDAGFASGVALSGETLASLAFDFASNLFIVRIYRRTGNWAQEALLTHPSNNTTPVLALSGDTLVIGDPGDSSGATGVGGDENDTSAPGSGAVSVFVRTGTTWSRQAYVKPSSTRPYASFGQAVALAGDTLVVGCPGEYEGGIPAMGVGAAYVFRRTGVIWAQEAILRGTPFARDSFGSSVALIEDLAAVGAPEDNLGSGAAYVFGRTGTTWAQRARVTPPGGARIRAGSSVAIGSGVLAVGAPNEESKATGVNGDRTDHSLVASGAVFVH